MKLRTKLVLISVLVIIVMAVTSCLILYSSICNDTVNGIVQSGIDGYTSFCAEFSNQLSVDKLENILVQKSYITDKFKRTKNWNGFSLKGGNEYLTNNIGFDVGSVLSNPNKQTIFANQTLLYQLVRVNNQYFFIANCTVRINESLYDISYANDITAQISKLRSLITMCATTISLCAVLAAIVIWVVIYRALSPIQEIKTAVSAFAKGNHSSRVALKRKDELQEVASAFNDMANTIEANIRSINEISEQRQLFIQNLSHELKTPIASIMLDIETIQNRKLSGQQLQLLLGNIYKQISWIEALSRKLMVLIMTDGLIEIRPVPISELFSAVRDSLERQLKERNLHLITQDNGACMLLDFDLMQSAVVNLVTNAMKASSIGQTIEVLADEHGIEVKDYGIGIPSQDLNSVTEPFYMVDKSRAHQNNSCGLGLSLVKSIVNAHGAQLVIRSMPGIGTTVRISWNSK